MTAPVPRWVRPAGRSPWMPRPLYRHRRVRDVARAPRWLRTRRDYPRATSIGRVWCRADGESHPTMDWICRSRAHTLHAASLLRRGVRDTRWTVLR